MRYLPQELEPALDSGFGIKQIISISPVGGGCINTSLRLETGLGIFFLKYNFKDKYPGMFETESIGLQLLKKSSALRTPEVIGSSEAGVYSFLLTEWIEKKPPGKNFLNEFGRSLAALHRNSKELFGLDHSNYIGSLQQKNGMHPQWADFFRDERLEPQLRLAFDRGLAPNHWLKKFTNFYSRIDEIFPEEKPALLHGDLWSGNYMSSEDGACLIDPAVYYGHREMDLAMTMLFGGFGEAFYEGYDQSFPLEKNHSGRIGYCNLYPLLVHLNLFGEGYAADIEKIIGKF